jgi:hypothetical protein
VGHPRGAVGGEDQGDAGRAHPAQLRPPLGGLADARVGVFEGLAERSCGRLRRAGEHLAQGFDGDATGGGAALVPAHPVGNGHHACAGGALELPARVLVLGASAPDVAQERGLQLGGGNRGHSP